MTERTAEEWGRLAVSLPGWRWMPGMRDGDDSSRCVRVEFRHGAAYDAIFWDGEDEGVVESDQPASAWPDPDDPATAGCLLALLGPGAWDNVAPGSAHAYDGDGWWAWVDGEWSEGLTLGRACIAAAEALGRWPGSEG